jgi:radical SAM protein with 4Fe4S-binding SPASM domain
VGEIRKVSSSLGRLLWLAFSGGEIFLRDDIVDITRIFYKNNRPVIILFPTNGLLPDTIAERMREVLKACRKSTIVVKLSVDGNEPVHDAIRGVKGGFRKTMETYHLLEKLVEEYPHFELGINTVFCSANQDCIGEIVESVSKLRNVKTHTLSLIRGRVSDKTLKDIDMEKYRDAIGLIESNLKSGKADIYRFRGARVKAAQDILQRRLIFKTIEGRTSLIPCYAGKLNLVLTETGDLYPCESFDLKLGNVREQGYDIKKIIKSDDAGKVLRGIRKNGCYCSHECYFMTNILFNPRMYPSLLKEYMQI